MGRMPFKKLHGAGNDFVFLDAWDSVIDIDAHQVQALCDRHFGIGADGVIVVRRPKKEGNAGFMDYINADGTLAQMCGNGVRCFAKYVVDCGYAHDDGDGIVVETRAGEKLIRVQHGEDGKVMSATVDMGAPILEPHRVPTELESNARTAEGAPFVGDAIIASPWGDFAFTCVSMGNPHAVCFIEDWDVLDDGLFVDAGKKGLESFDIDKVGAFYEAHAMFPEKANIEFAEICADGIRMRVFERGCGETLACGTGACATGVAAYLTGRASRASELILRGGTLQIEYDLDAGSVLMTGPAEESFIGSVSM